MGNGIRERQLLTFGKKWDKLLRIKSETQDCLAPLVALITTPRSCHPAADARSPKSPEPLTSLAGPARVLPRARAVQRAGSHLLPSLRGLSPGYNPCKCWRREGRETSVIEATLSPFSPARQRHGAAPAGCGRPGLVRIHTSRQLCSTWNGLQKTQARLQRKSCVVGCSINVVKVIPKSCCPHTGAEQAPGALNCCSTALTAGTRKGSHRY